MEFTLRYRGPLVASSRSDSRVAEKHAIRKYLHEQLAAHWAQDPRLMELNANLKTLQIPRRSRGHFEVDRPIIGQHNFFWRYPLCGYDFIPLVTHIHELHCHISIRLYRKLGRGGILFEGGDLDNRLKTFFDALRVPESPEQVPQRAKDMGGTNKDWPPMFCLLDDDRAITKLSIQSFKLLTPVPPDCSHPENYVELDMDVSVAPATPIIGSADFLFP